MTGIFRQPSRLYYQRRNRFIGGSASAPPVYYQYGLEFYGNVTGAPSGRVNRVRIPLEDGVSTQYPANVGAGSFCYEFYFKPSSSNATTATDEDARYSNIIIDCDKWGAASGYVIGVTRNGSGDLVMCFGQAGSGGSWATIFTTTDLDDNQWHHAAISRNIATGLVTIRIDGVLEASGTYDTNNWSVPAGYTNGSGQDNNYLIIAFEKHDVGFGYFGQIRDLRISNAVRYTSTFTPEKRLVVDSITVALYQFDEGSGTAVQDEAGLNPDGELLVGGSPSGPVWIGTDTVLVLVSASAATSTVNPTVVLGSIVVSPAAVSVSTATVNPTVVQGSISLTPNPAVIESDVIAPTVVLGNVAVTPNPTIVTTTTVNPTVIASGITIIPDPAVIEVEPIAPTVVLGSMTITPNAAVIEINAITPTAVLGSVSVTPAAANVATSTVNPTTTQGSMSVAPSPAVIESEASAPIVVLGSISFTPNPAVISTDTVDPTVQAGGELALTPEAISIASAAIAPTVVLGSMTIIPNPAIIESDVIAPTVVLGSVLVAPSAVEVDVVAMTPNVTIGNLNLTPSAAGALTAVPAPSVLMGSLSYSPPPARVRVVTLNPTVILTNPETIASIVITAVTSPLVSVSVMDNPYVEIEAL